ncbi:MAG TPA: NADH-quinone oxidoreductase subunit C [Ilumatobacteraceae bacterium]|jgi:NADH:ubiquinone oxidoreductase subunit C
MELLHGCITSESRGQAVVHPTQEQYLPLMKELVDEGYVVCTDLCGVDYLLFPERTLPEGVVPERFEVVANLIDLDRRRRLRVRLQVPAADPVAPSLFDLWPGTEAMERETYDMFGIRFDNHPDLTRILMPEEWIGHPLRKDDDEARIPVQFKGTR